MNKSVIQVTYKGLMEETTVSDELALLVLKIVKEKDEALISFITDFLNN